MYAVKFKNIVFFDRLSKSVDKKNPIKVFSLIEKIIIEFLLSQYLTINRPFNGGRLITCGNFFYSTKYSNSMHFETIVTSTRISSLKIVNK